MRLRAPNQGRGRCTVLIDGLVAGVAGRVEVDAFSVVVEDDEDLDRAVVGSDGMRNHGGELCRVAGLNQDGPVP